MKLTDLLALSHVPRWSICTLSRPQSVADHSFRVAVIAQELLTRLGYSMDAADYSWCLSHDGAESRSGDVSGKFKRDLSNAAAWRETEHLVCPWLADELGPLTRGLLKLADEIETYTYIRMYGIGHHARRVADSVMRRLVERAKIEGVDWPLVVRLVDDIVEERDR